MTRRLLPDSDGIRRNAGNFQVGTASNYLQIDPWGHVIAFGEATWFDDLRVEPTVRGSGSKVPTYGVFRDGLYAYQFDDAIAANEKEVNFKMQLPHGWKFESPVHLHIHWAPLVTGNAGDKVRWGLEYSIAAIGSAFPASAGSIIYATDPVSPPSTTPTQYVHYLTEFTDLSMTGITSVSPIILGRLFRNSSNAADTLAQTVALLYIDAHVEMDQFGSNSEFIK